MLLALLLAPANLKYESLGILPVRTKIFDLVRQGKEPLHVRVSWPGTTGKYPLILFSHGYMGSETTYQPLSKHWTSYGFIVIQPRHYDSLEGKSPAEKIRAVSFSDPRTFGNAEERVEDLKYALSHIDELLKGTGASVDKAHIGVGGHSYGGMTAAMSAGVKRPHGYQISVPQASAFLLLSPATTEQPNDSFAHLTHPVLVVSGTKDSIGKRGLMPNRDPVTRQNGFKYSPPGDKYLLWMEGAHHDLGGISGARYLGSGPADEPTKSAVLASSTAFWLAYLKGDAQAKSYLQLGNVKALRPGITWETR